LCNPCIEKCHPFFNFGSSRGSKDGEKIYLLGDYVSNALNRRLFNAVGAVSDGLLSDHRYLDYSGFGLAEWVLVSAPAYAFSAGLPILNCQGQVIGMQITDLAAVLPPIVFPATPLAVTGAVAVSGTSPVTVTGVSPVTVTGVSPVAVTGVSLVTGVTGTVIVSGGVTGVTGIPGTGFFGGTGTVALTGTIDIAATGTVALAATGTVAIAATGTVAVAATGTVGSTGSIGPFLLNNFEGAGLVAGPSEFFLRRVVKTIINGTCSRKFNCQLETICDPVGSFYRYKKAYAGVAYDVFTGVDYDVTVDYTAGLFPLGFPRVRLTSPLSGVGDFLALPSCKELVGIRVLGLAGLNPNDAFGVPNGFWYVPGGTAAVGSFLASGLPVSPFLGKLQPGDVITHIDGVALGDLNKQIAPSLITWRLCAGDQIEICYRRGGNVGSTGDNSLSDNYDNLFTFNACLADFPALMDYPWYAVNIFPLLARLPYPGFVFPVGQNTNPQFPNALVGPPFHPAF
jgi:hypothetical protein